VLLAEGNAGELEGVEEDFAGDAGEAAGVERWGADIVTEDGEDVGGGTFADAAVFVEEDDFVEAAFVGLFVPGEVLGPGGELGAAELAGAVAGIGFEGEANGVAPLAEAGGEGDDIKAAGKARGFKEAAVVADDGDAEGAVDDLIGGDELEERCVEIVRRGGKRDAQAGSITDHAGPMALPGKQDAIGNAEGAEDTPAVQEADLTGREAGFGGFANGVIVQQEAMHTPLFYRGAGTGNMEEHADRGGRGRDYWIVDCVAVGAGGNGSCRARRGEGGGRVELGGRGDADAGGGVP
jgi:hypothetical protein